MKLKSVIFFFFFGFFVQQTIVAQGFQIPETPKFQTSVYDYIGLLSPSQKKALENKLVKYSDSTSTQIVVAIIKSTEGENIAYLGAKWLSKWGIGGSEEKDNGILITLAKDDRKVNINTGFGVEHLMTDYTSRQIIERDIIPEFKRGDFYAGLDKGSDAIFKVMNGEYKGTRQQSNDGSPLPFILFIIFIFILFILISRGNRGNRGGGYRRNYRRDRVGRDILETIILSNSGRSSGGFGGFGGSSGGGSFGGGGFGGGFGGGMGGGGGATGGW